MPTRAMIIVAAGSASRFGGEKLMTEVAGRPLLAHTVLAVQGSVDECVVVCRHDHIRLLEDLGLGVELVPGGPTRTSSEMAGLAVVGTEPDLIGIHDGARPAVSAALIESVFARAAAVGGAVPVLSPDGMFIDRTTGRPMRNVMAVQTPQVFRGIDLHTAYSSAARGGYTGHDTVELMRRFSDVQVAAVAGDPDNIKVTYPGDLERVRVLLAGSPRSGPR